MENKQTAVDYIVNVVNSCIAPDYIPNEIVNQAKEMEKEQIKDAWENRTPKQRQTMKKVQTPDQVVLGYKTALVEGAFYQGLEKTAIQQLIDEIVEHLTYDDDLSDDSRTTLETIRLRCLGKLSIEKEQIINTFKHAQVLVVMNNELRAEQYYNETYKQQDK